MSLALLRKNTFRNIHYRTEDFIEWQRQWKKKTKQKKKRRLLSSHNIKALTSLPELAIFLSNRWPVSQWLCL